MSIARLMPRWVWALTLILAAALLVSAVACNDEEEEGGTPAAETPTAGETETATAGELGEQPQSPQELATEIVAAQNGALSITTGDNFFEENNLSAALGEAVTITVTNDGAATHNMRIAGPDGEFDTEDDAVTDPDAISGGASAELTFSPEIAGAYTFRCDFHPAEMGGQITIE